MSTQRPVRPLGGALRSSAGAPKGYVGKRPRTWLKLSDAGRRALSSHVAELQQIAARAGQVTARPDGG